MSSGPNRYRAASAATLADEPGVRDSVGSATRTFDAHRRRAFAEIDIERWRDWARDVKTHVLTNLPRYLEQVEERLTANGVRVHWAGTSDEALAALDDIVRDHADRNFAQSVN